MKEVGEKCPPRNNLDYNTLQMLYSPTIYKTSKSIKCLYWVVVMDFFFNDSVIHNTPATKTSN